MTRHPLPPKENDLNPKYWGHYDLPDLAPSEEDLRVAGDLS